ncbi:MAG: hypothetical protein U1F76_11270 [Candidatus Competibacteraceae bacterium]
MNDIPIGDLRLYDNYLPQLQAGKWFIRVRQTLTHNGSKVNQDTLEASQEFIVSAPQFSIDPNQIINRYPPAGSTGLYRQVLPYIVLNDPMLPWEREMVDPSHHRQPWLALMVFAESELIGGETNVTRAISTTVGDFLKLGGTTLAPKPAKEADIDNSAPCVYMQTPVSIFATNAPRLNELRFLSHCRQVNTGDKAMMGLNEHGLFSVIMSNRFPSTPPKGSTQPVKNIAHLVSLEGMEKYLLANASFGSYETVALVSLASWVFYSFPDRSEDFRALVLNLVAGETDLQKITPDRLWLRLTPPATRSGSDAAALEVSKRISDGYTPLLYHTRTGEETFAWYRGPLAPLLPALLKKQSPFFQTRTAELQAANDLPALLKKQSPFFTADAALIYDKTYGVFDCSLAAAWEAGRQAALSDRLFGQRLLDFRCRAHRFTDSLQQRLLSDHFSETQIDQVDIASTIQDQFLSLLTLNRQLLVDIGTGSNSQPATLQKVVTNTPTTSVKEDIEKFMKEVLPKLQTPKLQKLIQDDLAPIAEWLGKLMLLYPLPFNYLVPDERMLPVESIRFFYIDPNWLNALLDGALSIALESSRQTFFHKITKEMMHNAAMQALSVYRNSLRGVTPAAPPAAPPVICGLLLRSALVTGWPNLAVRPRDAAGNMLNILRMDHLSPTVLLCIFDGVPAEVELSEPQEGFGFGIDEDGKTVLRNLTTAIGKAIDKKFQVRDMTGATKASMRVRGGLTLNIAELVQDLTTALRVDALGPAAFALQMVKSPEAIIFKSQI